MFKIYPNNEQFISRSPTGSVEVREWDWEKEAERSILLKAVSSWRDYESDWFRVSFSRLPETVRVNPLHPDQEWVEAWLTNLNAKQIDWFSGPGSAWKLPFVRGSSEGETKIILNALHKTGRVTRQEEVSMLPVLALNPQPGEIILDLCASPGSKTTQICEHMGDSGAVVANEIVSGRINTLVSNIQRHSCKSSLVVQHDGRHIPMVPMEGYDRVLVDAPCTGSGTTRKNPDVWRKWIPSAGLSLHELQFDLLKRGISVTKPGGRIVYSTCSLDPIENEAVVSRILLDGGVKLISARNEIPEIPSNPGLTQWDILDDLGNSTDSQGFPDYLVPSNIQEINSQLNSCMRVWNDKIDGGGFFLAIFEKNQQSYSSEKKEYNNSESGLIEDHPSYPQPVEKHLSNQFLDKWGSLPPNLWNRGKSLFWSTEEIYKIWNSVRARRKKKNLIPGKRWHPLKVIHLGLIIAKIRKGELERITSKAARSLKKYISKSLIEVDSEIIDLILIGDEPEYSTAFTNGSEFRGSYVLFDNSGFLLSVWIGKKVTAMISREEKIILRKIRGI